MKSEYLLLGALAIGGAALIGRKAYNAAQLQLSLNKIGFKMSGMTAIMVLDIKVSNPTDSQFTANALTGTVRVNGQLVGNVSSYPNKLIAGYASTVIPVECNVSLLGAGLEIYNIVMGNKSAQATINFAGTATVNGIPAPLDLTYKIL